MNKDVQSAGRGGRFSAHLAPWLVAGFLAVATPWSSIAAATGPAGAGGQGIVVHGDWTITVSDADGREVSSRSFRNALVSSGEFLLARLLGFGEKIDNGTSFAEIDASLSHWHILVRTTGTVDNEECNAVLGVPFSEQNPQFAMATRAGVRSESRTLTLERDLKLTAACISGAGFSISEVWSGAQTAVGRPPVVLSIGNPFTKKELDTPIDVLPGQVVSLSVTFSFS
jgi:hypothetical protein